MSDSWTLSYEGWDPKQEGLREALCTLGNGVFATRGAAEEHGADGTHYPGTYVAGGYNQLSSEVAGRIVVNEDLVNFTNWLPLSFRPMDGEWLEGSSMATLDYRQSLLMREGVFVRELRVRDAQGRITRIQSRRLVHMRWPHLAALEWTLTPENWSGELIVHSALDGSVRNTGVARYRQLNGKHLEEVSRGSVAPEGIYLLVRTNQSRFEVAQAARIRLFRGRGRDRVEAERRLVVDAPERIAEEIRMEARAGAPVRIEKVVALHTSRDRGSDEPAMAARVSLGRAGDFEGLLEAQRRTWKWLWHRHDVQVEAGAGHEGEPSRDQLILRLHLFHLLQTVSPNTIGRDVGVPARGLHGEAYRGHIFWDELFILPLFVYRAPSIARTLMLYRYNRLDAARALAKQAGHAGAAFPWQSSSDGREATQQLHLNPRSGRWDQDHSRLQRHVNAAIAFNLWRYYEATGDRAFMEQAGAEIILEIARFWSSVATQNPETGRYDIVGVMGPDEYHEKYPGAEMGGLRNNAYTNVMASWCIQRGFDVLEVIGDDRRAELTEVLGLDPAELDRWREVSARLKVPFHDGVISQFEGYERLEAFDWEGYRERYGNIDRLDRILKAEGDSPDHYQASKQPDVIMLFYLFTYEELRDALAHLSYAFDEDDLRRTVEYYQARTSHGSTLSKVVFTSVVHRRDCELGCRLFLRALHSDLQDVQGGTTPEGIHLGAMAGTVDIVMRHYAGLELTHEFVALHPDMPQRIRRIGFRARWRRRWLDLELLPTRVRVTVDADEPDPVPVHIYDQAFEIAPGDTLEVPIEPLAKTHRRAPIAPDTSERIRIDVDRLEGAPM